MSGTACHSCKQLVEVVHTTDQGLSYCPRCLDDMVIPSEVLGVEYLLAHLPYEKGDRVECRTAGVHLDGVGTIKDVSFEIERGGGTMIFPAFLVAIDEPAGEDSPEQGWYHEICLTKLTSAA